MSCYALAKKNVMGLSATSSGSSGLVTVCAIYKLCHVCKKKLGYVCVLIHAEFCFIVA